MLHFTPNTKTRSEMKASPSEYESTKAFKINGPKIFFFFNFSKMYFPLALDSEIFDVV